MSGVGPSLEILGTVRNRWLPDQTGIVVLNRGGTGRLRFACGPYDLPTGALNAREEFLVLDDEPLIRFQGSECPTCPRLLQASLGDHTLDAAEAINQITLAQWAVDPEGCVQALQPVFQLLPPFFYRLSLLRHAPTDGEGNLFWAPASGLKDGHALPWATYCEPGFLAATQHTSKFDLSAWKRAKKTYRSHPLLGLKVGGRQRPCWMAIIVRWPPRIPESWCRFWSRPSGAPILTNGQVTHRWMRAACAPVSLLNGCGTMSRKMTLTASSRRPKSDLLSLFREKSSQVI